MRRLLCSKIPAPGQPTELPEAEAEHATRVLRLRDGDQIEALDGKGNAAVVALRMRAGKVMLEFAFKLDASASSQAVPPITLEMAILKGEAMEWVVEKAVELGVQTLIPCATAHTVVQIKQKGPESFQQRWQKIADQALKQCGRLEAMKVALPLSLEELLAQNPCSAESPRLWCDESGREEIPYLPEWLSTHPIRSARLLIGPEGGWSALERDLLLANASSGTYRIGLGPWVLRAETAALFGVSLLVAQMRRKH